MSDKNIATKGVNLHHEPLQPLTKSLFDALDATRAENWTEFDEYLTKSIFIPLDDDIQLHFETNARDRMQATIKQRKQGHKKPLLPFVQATEYDIKGFSPEYRAKLENDFLPMLLRKCLNESHQMIEDRLRKLLRSEEEIDNEILSWDDEITSFGCLIGDHRRIKELDVEYEKKKELIEKVNQRTTLVKELTEYYKEQIRPLEKYPQFSFDAYCPPTNLYFDYSTSAVELKNVELRKMVADYEKKYGEKFFVRGESYLEGPLYEDIWDFARAEMALKTARDGSKTGRDGSKTGRGSLTVRASTSASSAPSIRASASASSAPNIAKIPTKTTPMKTPFTGNVMKPTANAKLNLKVSPSVEISRIETPVPAPVKVEEEEEKKEEEDLAAKIKPLLIMDRPISHIRAKRDEKIFDINNNTNRRVNIMEGVAEKDIVDDDDVYVKVVCRIRPILPHEDQQIAISAASDKETIIQAKGKSDTTYKMHHAAGPTVSQIDFYNSCEVVPLLEKALNGQFVTVFAYGQTGSGKTHSIAGPEDVIALHEGVRIRDPENKVAASVKGVLKDVLEFQLLQHGIMPRGCRHIFDRIVEIEHNDPNIQFDVRCSYVEIYNEQLFDLLSEAKVPLEVKINTGDREGFYVAGLTEINAQTTDDVMKIFMDGAHNRSVASHALNRESSRSHALFSMVIEKRRWVPKENTLWVTRGKVTLVDLAGSESVKTTKTQGKGLLETQGINTSLLHLSNIVAQLAKEGLSDSSHIPWRNSKLTMLLMESLSNSGTTLMLANVSPSAEFLPETTNTLNFATKAANISGIKVKKQPAIENDLDVLRNDLFKMKKRCEALEDENQKLRDMLASMGVTI
eukprot:c21619_g1_i4.p1 GENE.c21619_g1_i4~~c21619_g1_i4.p1  ORF type:complete len:860 (+),score=348.41 c21619_g1_i4:23-2581(+)